MEPQLKPVPIDDSQTTRWQVPGPASVEAAAPNKVLRNTYWLLALSMLPTIAGAYAGMAINFAGFYMTSPIMAPLLMFGAMIASLFVVAALQRVGRAGGVRVHVHFRREPRTDADLCRRSQERRAAGRARRRNDRRGVLCHGDDRNGVQARLQLPAQISVRRAGPADHCLARQSVLPDSRLGGDDLGGRRADFLTVHAARRERYR